MHLAAISSLQGLGPDLKAVVSAVDRLTVTQHKGALDYIGVLSVIATLLVLIVYTIETYRLRKAAQHQVEAANAQTTAAQAQVDAAAKQLAESQRQTENAHRPIIILAFEDILQPSYRPQQLVYRNIGTAPALDVQTGPCPYETGHLILEAAQLVQQGDRTPTGLGYVNQLGKLSWNEGGYDRLFDHLGNQPSQSQAAITIHYRSPDGVFYNTQYSLLLSLTPESFRFVQYRRSGQ